MSIQYKIIFGYMVLIVAIIGMIIIMVRERNRVLVIETEAQTIHRVQHTANKAPSDGVITGYGVIDDKLVYVYR